MISPTLYSISYYIIQEIIYLLALCPIDFSIPVVKFAFPYLMLIFLPLLCLFQDIQLH